MNHAIAWFANNHVAANLLMALIVVGGLLSLPRLKQEIFPEIDLPIIRVAVEYPGASPREVEAAICIRIEEQLQGLQGVRRLHSNASEGLGTVSVEKRFLAFLLSRTGGNPRHIVEVIRFLKDRSLVTLRGGVAAAPTTEPRFLEDAVPSSLAC